jgi:hypothetical protein
MSIFDLTPARALANAIEIAHAKDRQNTRRVQPTEISATLGLRIRVGRMVLRVWARMADALTDLRSSTASHPSSV